ARAAFQGRVDHCRDSLCELVGRQGRMSAKDALATEAAVYSDTDAVEAKLADGIRTFDEVLASLTAQVSQNSQPRMAAVAANTGASAMTTQKAQMLSGASPTAVAAAEKSAAVPAEATIEAPAAPEPVASAPVVAAAAAKPKPGETCATCGQVMPNDDDDMPADSNASAPGYT